MYILILELQTMGSMSCLDPLAFLLVSPKRVNPWIHSLAVPPLPSQGTVGPCGWKLNRVSFSILLTNITSAKTCHMAVSLVLNPNKPASNWRLNISDIEITSIWIRNTSAYYLVSLVQGLLGYWLLLNFIVVLTKACWWLKVFGRKCHTCVNASSLFYYCASLCYERCSSANGQKPYRENLMPCLGDARAALLLTHSLDKFLSKGAVLCGQCPW